MRFARAARAGGAVVAGCVGGAAFGAPVLMRSIATEQAELKGFKLQQFDWQWMQTPAVRALLRNEDSELCVELSGSGLGLMVGMPSNLTAQANGNASGRLTAGGKLNWTFEQPSCIAEAKLLTPLVATFGVDVTTLSTVSAYFPLLKEVVAAGGERDGVHARLTVHEGATVPIVPRMQLERASMRAEMDLVGAVKLKPGGLASQTAQLFSTMGVRIPTLDTLGVEAEIAPMKIELSPGGRLHCNRVDLLLFSTIQLCAWGDAKLSFPPNQPVTVHSSQFNIGIPNKTLQLLPGLRHTDAEVCVPVVSSFGQPNSVEWDAVKAQLISLAAAVAVDSRLQQSTLVPDWVKGGLKIVTQSQASGARSQTTRLPPLQQPLPWDTPPNLRASNVRSK